MKRPVRVAVQGAAGNIGYSLLPRIASGEMLGADQPVILHLIDIPQATGALVGVRMELEDCAFGLLDGVVCTDDLEVGYGDVAYAILAGGMPRKAGMERADLLAANGAIYTVQGRALDAHAAADVKVLVVGNPANTNCLVAQSNARRIDAANFTALTRLDHNRAIAQIAEATSIANREIEQVAIWGNHSNTQYPDLTHATADGAPVIEVVSPDWISGTFIPTVQQRGAAVIAARGASSAASAASAIVDHMHDWVLGSNGAWVSMAVVSDGSYDVPAGLVSSFPCTTADGSWTIVDGLDIDDTSRRYIDTSIAELVAERDTVQEMGLLG